MSSDKVLVLRLLTQGHIVNYLSNTIKNPVEDKVGQYKKNVCKLFAIVLGFLITKLIKLARVAGFMHEADQTYCDLPGAPADLLISFQ